MIEPTYYNLNTLFADRVFRIPKYQRYYSWTGKERNELYSDIKKIHIELNENKQNIPN